MKFLNTNTISAVSITSGTVLSAWPVSNIRTEQPRQRTIGSATSITIRATLTGSSDTLALSNWLGDSGTYAIDGGAATAFSSAQLENAYGFDPWGLKTTWRKKPLFISISGSSTVDISLTTSTDVKGSPLTPTTNSIANWRQDSGATGRFEDSSNAIVNISDHGQVLLGGFVTIGGSEYQITKIIGDGTDSGSITLSSSVASGAVTALKLPVSVGILRVGNSTSVANPSELERNINDYSTRRIGPNGSYQTILRNIGRSYTLSSIYTQTDADEIIGISNARRGLPLPVEVLSDFSSERDLLSIFASVGTPAETYANKTGTFRTVSFNLVEAL
tara:strand:+ start:504 stop:1499 length:996 start_codon:yes stop_codon:yes gene_type:complete